QTLGADNSVVSMMVPDHASRALGALPALHSWPQSTAQLHVRGALNRRDRLVSHPLVRGTGSGPPVRIPGVTKRSTKTRPLVEREASKPRAIANHLDDKE